MGEDYHAFKNILNQGWCKIFDFILIAFRIFAQKSAGHMSVNVYVYVINGALVKSVIPQTPTPPTARKKGVKKLIFDRY